MNSVQESSEMEKVTGFRSCFTRMFYLGRNKSERVICSFCFYSECSFFWPDVIPFPSFSPLSFHSSFLPSVSFSFIWWFLLTRSYNWTGTWCTITGLIKFIQEQMFFSLCFTHCSLSPSLSFSWTVYSWSIFFQTDSRNLFLFLVYQKKLSDLFSCL